MAAQRTRRSSAKYRSWTHSQPMLFATSACVASLLLSASPAIVRAEIATSPSPEEHEADDVSRDVVSAGDPQASALPDVTAEPPREASPREAAPETQGRVPSTFAFAAYGRREHDWFDGSEWFRRLARAQVICVGARADEPAHLAATQALISALARRAAVAGRRLAVITDAVDVADQSAFSDFALGRLTFEELDEKSRADLRAYAPLFNDLRQRNVEVAAVGMLNASNETRAGESATGPETKPLPSPPRTLREAWRAHQAALKTAEARRVAQSAPNETEAAPQNRKDALIANHVIARFLAPSPAVQVIVVAARDRCTSNAVPARLLEEARARVLSVLPQIGTFDAPPTESEFDYTMVLSKKSGD